MAKTETTVRDFKINTGTYSAIVEHLPEIGEDELIFTDDKNIPIPTVSDNGKVIGVVDGDFSFIEQGGGGSGGSQVSIIDWSKTEETAQ